MEEERREGGGQEDQAGAGNGLHWLQWRVTSVGWEYDEWSAWAVMTRGGDPPIRCPVNTKHLCGQGGAHNEWSPHPPWWHQDTGYWHPGISAILMKITPGQHLNTGIVMSPAQPRPCLQSVLQVIISQRNVMPRTQHPRSDLLRPRPRPDLRS